MSRQKSYLPKKMAVLPLKCSKFVFDKVLRFLSCKCNRDNNSFDSDLEKFKFGVYIIIIWERM